MQIHRSGSRPSQKGPSEYFTGNIRVDPIIQAPDQSRVTCACVAFEPGARSAWHTHPLGQTLIVTSGFGWAQCWGESIEEIRPGDVIWCPRPAISTGMGRRQPRAWRTSPFKNNATARM